MKKIVGAVCTALLAMSLHTAPALAADVTVTLPSFPVILNGVTIEQSKNQYPMLVYKDITYVPMTWADTRLLGLESSWTQQTGLVIKKATVVQEKGMAQDTYKPYSSSDVNKNTYKATVASGKITVNGVSITNSAETYPLLVFRDVTYFPLTWRFAVTEFGWDYTFDSKNGLQITPKETVSNNDKINTNGEIIGKKVTVTDSGVHLRIDAGISSTSIGTATKGETLIVIGTKTIDEKLWYQVMRPSDGNSMWIASWYTEIESGSSVNTSSVNKTDTTNSSASMVGQEIIVTGSLVNLRADTSTTAAVLGQVANGEKFIVLAEKQVDGASWYQVKMSSGAKVWIAGWLTQKYTEETKDNSNYINSDNNIISMVGKKVEVNASSVNLRTEAGTGSTLAGTVNSGVQFTVLAEKTVDSKVWYQVKYGSNQVWIASWYTKQITDSTVNMETAKLTHLTLQSVKQQDGKTVITLYHGAGNAYSTLKATANQLVLQLNNVYLNTNDSINQDYSGALQHLQVQDAGNTALKVTFDLQKGAYCTVKEDGEYLIITAYNQHAANESGLTGKVIVLDPGHGGSDPGAVGRVLGVTDAEIGLNVGQRLRDLLEASGATVIMTRNTDIRVGLNDRPTMANEAEADLFVSIHGNSATNTAACGIQVYYYAPSTNANLYAQSYVRKELASKVSAGLQATTGTTSDVRTANYAVLRENDRPSILVETGFLSNAEEEALLAQDSYRQKLAQGIYDGIVAYLNQY